MHQKLRRRDFLAATAAAALLGTDSKEQEKKEAQREVRLERDILLYIFQGGCV